MPKKDKEEQRIEIVPSNQAISTVTGWLGISAAQAFPEDENGSQAGPNGRIDSQKRSKFLGLGATYVPHHKAVGFAAAIDERLKKRLELGTKRKAAQSIEEESEGGHQLPQNELRGKHKHSISQDHQQQQGTSTGLLASTSGRAESSGDEDSDDDDKGKAAMVGRKKKALAPVAHGNMHEKAWPVGGGSKAEQEALLFGDYSEQLARAGGNDRKKTKKKKKKKHGLDGGVL